MKFGTRVRLMPSNDRGEFELDRAKSNNNTCIAKNSVALGHETHNTIGYQWSSKFAAIGQKNYDKLLYPKQQMKIAISGDRYAT